MRTTTLPLPPALSSFAPCALFLDFDGTLVQIAARPDAIEVATGLPALLLELADRLDGRLAIVTGRQLADLDRYLGPIEIAMAGSHGGEFREAGAREAARLAEPLPGAVVSELDAFAKEVPGVLIETKPFSAAVHYRAAPEAAGKVMRTVEAVAQETGLVLKHGKMVVELTTPGSDKGVAVDRFMAMPRFAGSRPVFVGDDMTDEDAFKAVLNHGGCGILVGSQRETEALWRLPGVAEVHAWLKAA
ncbi:MAG TPA: trehalose-phosphatase [Novosphingobium sp.]|nr:trehalose-phosphatase [Novosphingobium sp.]